MATDAADVWRNCFRNWPSEVERRGVLVTTFGEQIPFDGFAISEEILLVERRTPDTVGARTVLLDYRYIQAVKITDVIKPKSFASMGFTFPTSKK